MRVVIVSNYYHPESVGAGIWVTQLARDLAARGHQVTVVTSFPSYPAGRIFPGYRNRLAARESIGGVEVIRTLTLATPSKAFVARLAAFGTFCLSAAPGYWRWRRPADVVYAILPPLPLGAAAWAIARFSGAKLVVNVQDIYPDVAVSLGYLRNRPAIAFFRFLERWIYRRAEAVTVISPGFRDNLLAKGVPAGKIRLTPNWADPDEIAPGEKHSAFRRETGAGDGLLVVYSGGLTHNAELDTVLDAAALLERRPVMFALVGDGVRKPALEARAAALGLDNVRFLPFQPLERYAEVLAAADVTLATLNAAAAIASAPSKIYKQMAAARPVVAIAAAASELARLIARAGCGRSVAPGDAAGLASVLEHALEDRAAWAQMGRRGREYLERHCGRRQAVQRIEAVLSEVVSLRPAAPRRWSGVAFRLRDLLLAAPLLVLLSPLLALCALAVRLSSPGPVLFRQQRLGLHGHPFELLKFRSMIHNAPDWRLPDGSAYSGGDDPRLTRVGRFLRRTSLDELPQLLNVLRGEMSLVGPRPDQVDQLRFYSETERRKLSVKPGITGLAQISGRNAISWERRKALDVEYARRRSFAFDLAILARTLPYVLLRRDIHTHDGDPDTLARATD